jgi:cytochrome c-type biogenesis protein CcmH/NrfG
MADEAPPGGVAWYFNLLRQDFGELRKEMNENMKQLVSNETFRSEQSRVNEKFEAVTTAINELAADLAKEVQARVTAEQARLQQKQQEQRDREKEAASRRWQIFAMVASPVVTLIIGFIFVAVVTRLGGTA